MGHVNNGNIGFGAHKVEDVLSLAEILMGLDYCDGFEFSTMWLVDYDHITKTIIVSFDT